MLQDLQALVELEIYLLAVLVCTVEHPALHAEPLDFTTALGPDLLIEVKVVLLASLPPLHN